MLNKLSQKRQNCAK